MKAIKCALGVKSSTPNIQCLVEIGYPPITQYIRQKQLVFYSTFIHDRQNITHDPLNFVFNINECRYPSNIKFFKRETCPDYDSLESLRSKLATCDRVKSILYCSINTTLSTHEIYTRRHTIPEYKRKFFTRMRLSSHDLKIETGRWNIPPTPRDERLCSCLLGIQDERHIIEECSKSDYMRSNFRHINFTLENILNHLESFTACNILYELYTIYSN